jgi:hypothetical protein
MMVDVQDIILRYSICRLSVGRHRLESDSSRAGVNCVVIVNFFRLLDALSSVLGFGEFLAITSLLTGRVLMLFAQLF